jgi:hypothetical protein
MTRLKCVFLPRILCTHPLEIRNERFFAIRNMRVVLDVLVTRVLLDRHTRLTLIEHQIIERLRVAFVPLQIVAHFDFSKLPPLDKVRLVTALIYSPSVGSVSATIAGVESRPME